MGKRTKNTNLTRMAFTKCSNNNVHPAGDSKKKISSNGQSVPVGQNKILTDDMLITEERGVGGNGNLTEGAIATSVFLVTLFVYTQTMHPSLPGGDSGELIVAAHEFGVAHPPGYPLFTLLAKLFIYIVPGGSVAWRVTLMSVLCAASAGSFIYSSIYRLTASHGAGILGSGMFSFGQVVWTWSVTAEVFSLNNLLLSVLVWIAVAFEQRNGRNSSRLSIYGAFVCGLCLSNQHTSVLYIVVIIPWVFYLLWIRRELTVLVTAKCSLSFVCGLLPYFYLPLASHLRLARWTWGDQASIWGFLTHVLRREYGTLDLLKEHTGQGFYMGLRAYLDHAARDFSRPFLMLFVSSLCSLYLRQRSQKRSPSILLVLWLMLVGYLSFFCWRANLDINKPLFFKVVERFWLQSDQVVCILAAVAVGDIFRYTSFLFKVPKVDWPSLAAVVLIGLQISCHWSKCDHSSNHIIEDFARQNLQAFPTNSIILTKGDLPSNSFRYFHLCENVRTDLHLFDQEVLTYEWSLPTMRGHYPGIMFPGDLLYLVGGKLNDGRKAFTFSQLINANYKSHALFACIGVQEYEPSWQEAYTLWPFGVCSQLVRKGTVFDADRWVDNTSRITGEWIHPWDSVDDGTWEFVANSEMWRARTVTGLFLLELSMGLPKDSKETKELLKKSYQVYSKELAKYPDAPSFWHRNFAIVCERLAHSSDQSQAETIHLLGLARKHFQAFLQLEPQDADAESIRRAVATLGAYLE